jgi:hypothetical protein
MWSDEFFVIGRASEPLTTKLDHIIRASEPLTTKLDHIIRASEPLTTKLDHITVVIGVESSKV